MKRLLIPLFLLSALSAPSQSLPDSSWVIPGTRKTVFRYPGLCLWCEGSKPLPRYDTVYFGADSLIHFSSEPTTQSWLTAPAISFTQSGTGKFNYDSCRIDIYGDTLLVIRRMAKLKDSIENRYWTLKEYADDIIEATQGARVTTKQLKRWNAAVRRYYDFLYGKKKITRK